MSKAMIDVQWAFISIATASLAHFILRIVLGRELGPEGLGIYTLVFTLYSFGIQFAAFGIHAALTKYVAEFLDDHATIRNYVSSGMTCSIITGATMGIALYFLAPYLATTFFKIPEMELLIQLTALCYPFIAVQKAVLGTLNGFRKMHLYAFLNIIQNASIVTLSVILVLSLGMNILGAVMGLVVPTVLISVLSPFLIRGWIERGIALWNTKVLRETTIFGVYFVLGNSFYFLQTQVDSILIGYYLGSVEVGIYAVAVLLTQSLTLIPNATQRVTAPSTATLYGKRDVKAVRRLITSTMKKIFIISVGIATIIAISGQYFITLIFTDEFLLSYVPLLILLIGHTIFAPFEAVGSTLASIGKINIAFYIHAVCGVLNVLLNILLIPLFGINGAAAATTITLILDFAMNTIVIHKILHRSQLLDIH
ncbi:flippase [Methanoculleus bourgensis]|uniref:flippase n=1 Tax=Methanoculleus bourgensis TaxID=83986 RepID=UPI001EE1C6CA|nr:flippase [Methanoculleus bourgensis]